MAALNTQSMLVVFQGMDGSGKDGTIDHVFSGVNPAGVVVTSFKQPSSEDLSHDFLWRVHRAAPAAGRIGIFNRSHYEDVLVTRIHPELLAREHRPDVLANDAFWTRRLSDITNFERLLVHSGTVVLKFFLNISKAEQRRRLLDRLDEPGKSWKFQPTDLAERQHWNAYMAAYQHAIAETATPHTHWHVIPADHKWFARMVVAEIVQTSLETLDLTLPQPTQTLRTALDEARRALSAE